MRRRLLGGIAAVLTGLGCYSTARDGSRPSPACMQAERVIVENNADESVEVRLGQVPLGMARPGRSSIQLPPNTPSQSRGFAALGVSGKFWKVVYGSTPAAGKVWVSVECPKG
jgi:hypothetical protein